MNHQALSSHRPPGGQEDGEEATASEHAQTLCGMSVMSLEDTLGEHRMDAEVIPLGFMRVRPQCAAIDDGNNGCHDDHDLR